ncbi:FAD-linked oxidase C-terminal domain-containing protein [Clostridioides difficile]|nr:FAD-linked oxidase C-terminal domain-containing protein [Clostridioides difficile]
MGYAKKECLHESNTDAYIMLIKNIKLAIDPRNILKPGKIY